jgi:hypothetical protein
MNAILLLLCECGVGLRILTNLTQFHSGFFTKSYYVRLSSNWRH